MGFKYIVCVSTFFFLVFALSAIAIPFELSQSVHSSQRPILIVGENNQNMTNFSQLIEGQGLSTVQLFYNNNLTIIENAEIIHDAAQSIIENASFDQIDIISFGKGSLLVQAYAHNLSVVYQNEIKTHVMIAAPLQGESTNCFSSEETNEASFGSDLIWNLSQKLNKNISYLTILGMHPNCPTLELSDGTVDASSNLLRYNMPLILLKQGHHNITSNQSAKIIKSFLIGNLSGIKPKLTSGESYVNPNDPNADSSPLSRGSVTLQLNNINTSQIFLKRPGHAYNLTRNPQTGRWYYLNNTKTRIAVGNYDIHFIKNNVLKDSGIDVAITTSFSAAIVADSDEDTILDPIDSCPNQFGNWCHGCPIPSCGSCMKAVCPAIGAPSCINAPNTTSCGTQDCDVLDSACRDYRDTSRFCDGQGTCRAGICTQFQNAPAQSACGNQESEYSCAFGTTQGSDTALRNHTMRCDGSGACLDNPSEWKIDEICTQRQACYHDDEGNDDDNYFCKCVPKWIINSTWSLCSDGMQSTNYIDDNQCNTEQNKPQDQIRNCSMLVFHPQETIYKKKQVIFNLTTEGLMQKISYQDNNDSREKTLCTRCDEYGFTRARFQNLKEGGHNITITAIQNNELFANLSLSFFIDSTKPRILKTDPKRYANGKFSVEFTELNPSLIQLHLENASIEVPQENCHEKEKSTVCDIDADLSPYDQEEITYLFSVEDIAGNKVESKPLEVLADPNAPIIDSLSHAIDERSVTFNMTIREPNFDRAQYLDGSGRWKILCTRLTESQCVKRSLFNIGNHSILINVTDDAKNYATEHVSFEIV